MFAALLLSLSLLSPTAQAQGPCGMTDCPVTADMSAALAKAPAGGGRMDTTDWFKVAEGQITFDVEGTEGGRYHSRILHWPGGASGVTIGRGYDMKFRTAAEIKNDLMRAGVDAETAAALAKGAGLSGSKAKTFVRNNKKKFELTPQQQHALFETVYDEYADMTKRLVCKWAGQSGAGCASMWDGLDPAIKTMLVDLRYRGDLTSSRWSSMLSESVLANDLQAFADIISDRSRWSSVPEDRFNRRSEYIQDAAAGGGTTNAAVTDAGSSALAPETSPRPVARPEDTEPVEQTTRPIQRPNRGERPRRFGRFRS